MNMFLVIIFGLLVFGLAFFLRIAVRLKKKIKGVDAWYYLLSVEDFKKRKKIPICSKNYLLDTEEHCYPPGFTIFLSALPTKFLKKYHWLICSLIGSFHLLLLYFFTYLITQNLLVSFLAALVCAFTYTLVIETTTLNSRALGSLFFTFTFLATYQFIATQSFLWLAAALLFGFFLLMTHKMSTQALVFSFLGMAVIFHNIQYLFALALIFVAAFVLSGGFYRQVLRGHRSTLMYWKKHLSLIGTHQVYDSPVYKRKNVENRRLFALFHQKGIRGVLIHAKRLLGHNPWLVFIIFILPSLTKLSPLQTFLFWWVVLVYVLALLTTFFGPLRFLGEGYKYIKFSIFPLGFLAANLAVTNNLFLALFFLLIFINLYGISKVAKPAYEVKEKDLAPMLDFLKNSPVGGIMCLPTHLADLAAYSTHKKILWGVFGFGWDKLEEFFPVFKKPVEYFFKKYNLHFLLLDKNFAAKEHLNLSPNFYKILENNSYLLLGCKK